MSDAFDEARPADPAAEVADVADARLLDDLRRALGPDHPPAGLVGRSAELIAFASFDRELAELLEADEAAPTGVRGPSSAGGRLMFRARDGELAIELTVAGDRLDGQILGGEVTEIVLEQRTGPGRSCAVDALGRFTVGDTAAGPTRLRILGGWTRAVTTDWFLL